jgi:hypothetical protein
MFGLAFFGIGVSVIALTNFNATISCGGGGFDEPRKYS